MNSIKEELRLRIPNIKAIRKLLSWYRVKEIDSMLLPSSQRDAAELDGAFKRELIGRYTNKPTRDLSRTIEQASVVVESVSDSIKKRGLYEDILFCRLAYGFTTDEYVAFSLENKSLEDRLAYVSDLMRIRYHCVMNDLADASIFNDKYKAYLYYKPYYNREAIVISKPSDYEMFCEFVKRNEKFVRKGLFDSLGRSVELIDLKSGEQSVKEVFDSLISEGKQIVEELIVQTNDLARYNQTSVNTIRAVTFRTRVGIEVPYCILRMGRRGSFVDNGGAGGIIACVDFKTGIVVTDGYDEKGGVFINHPDSGVTIKDSQLPDWNQLRYLCEHAAKSISTVRFIGWDLAHTSSGWVIVEGNAGCQLIAQQTITGGIKDKIERIKDNMELMI